MHGTSGGRFPFPRSCISIELGHRSRLEAALVFGTYNRESLAVVLLIRSRITTIDTGAGDEMRSSFTLPCLYTKPLLRLVIIPPGTQTNFLGPLWLRVYLRFHLSSSDFVAAVDTLLAKE